MAKHSKENIKTVKKRKLKLGRVFLFILVILAMLGGYFTYKAYTLLDKCQGNWVSAFIAAFIGHDTETVKNLQPIQVLILGESGGNTDTIIVCEYNPAEQKAAMLSIPRDTFVGDSYYSVSSYDKINAIGVDIEERLANVNKVTGLDIHHYIIIDTKAFIKLVDLIGGIDYEVPIDMSYDDTSQNLHIHLNEGYQHLTGEQVEGLVRFRHNNDGSTYSYEYGIEDYGRMKTQRGVIKTIAQKLISFKSVTKISDILKIMEEYVDTDLKFDYVKDYIPYALNINLDEVPTDRLPGESEVIGGIWFFLSDEDETEQMVNEMFNTGKKKDELEAEQKIEPNNDIEIE